MGYRQVRLNLPTMTKALSWLVLATCVACGAENQATGPEPVDMPPDYPTSTGGGGGQSVVGGSDSGSPPDAAGPQGPQGGGGGLATSDAAILNQPPKIGAPGCGFAAAAFCDTFDVPAKVRGRAGDLDPTYWSAGRMAVQASTTRAMGIGMAVIPACRAGVSNHVWPNDDTLVCGSTADVASQHLLVAVAAQNYGQNGYRIRQPFDFAGRTGKIVFDATVTPLSPLHGWISLAITEDPVSMPGYSIQHNDEGTIIPKNAVEVHFLNAPGDTGVFVRNVHVFRDFVDTVYAPPSSLTPSTKKDGKLNHFEVTISQQGVEARITPYSDDGVHFAAPSFTYKVDTAIPFSRGYVQLSVHNHATLKYTTAPNQVDASIARIDNIGFDGPVLSHFREYEVPNALVKFSEHLGDPYNTEDVGYDVGYTLQDAAKGPKQTLHFQGVDISNVKSARLSFSAWMDFLTQGPRDQYAIRARLNGKTWLEYKLTAAEALFFTAGPTTVDPSGAKIGDPGSQGRFSFVIDVPVDQLVAGDNTVEFVSSNIPVGYPPGVCNIDLVLGTN
jgi:hypothetical protein